MVKMHIKTGRVILDIPNLTGDQDTPENNATLTAIRKTLNMQKFGTFVNVGSVVDDQQNHRIVASNPTGEFCRVVIGAYSYDVNPFVISEVKDKNDNLVVPAGNIGGNPYYTAEQLSKSFQENYF